MKRMIATVGVVVVSGLIGMASPAATLAARKGRHELSGPHVSIVRLFSYVPQRHPKAALPHRPDYFCKYLSDGSAIVCCLFNWNDNHGYGGWDCSIGAA